MAKKRCWLAVMVAAALLTGALSGCGKAEQESGSGGSGSSGNGNSDGSGSASENGGDAGQKKGMYVEKQEALPEELSDWTIVQMYKAEDKLRLLAMKQDGDRTVLSQWEKQGEDFAEVTPGWFAGLELPALEWMELGMAQGEGDRQYLYTGYTAEGEEAFKTRLWKGEGDTVQEITPQEWTVPDEEYGGYEFVTGIAALDNGTLAAISYSSVQLLSGEDGSILENEQPTALYEGGVVTDGTNTYLCTGEQIERRKDGKSAGAENIPYPGSTGGDGAVVIGGAGSLAVDVLKDGTLVGAVETGIYRLAAGDAQGQWEQLAEGMETDFSMTELRCTDFVALEDGSIYALFQENGEMKLNRYEYDPEAVSQVKEVLKLYTVYENPLLKQAAAAYHKAHPEVKISIEYEYPQYYYETPDYDAVYQKLNTMLMGDGAPDIVVMDHLNLDSYADKGLLADIDDVVKPMEEGGELLSNITGAYVREDGKRYVVPLQFGFNMVMGRDITVEDMSSMEALAGFLAGADSGYLGDRTVAELVDEFYPYFCDEIVSDKQLDREAMGRYLDYLKMIGDNCGIVDSRPEDKIMSGMWELASEAKMAFNRVVGFIDCMFPMSMVDYIKGDYTAFENRFIPSALTGICSRTEYMDTARDFIKFALSQEVQDVDSFNGFPVNRASLKKLAAKDRSNFSAATMIKDDEGGYIEFDSKPYPQETADALAALCETLDKPVKEDSKIREVLIECLGGFLDGSQSREDTVQKIEDGLKMYLAE